MMRITIGVLFGYHIYEGARSAPFTFPIVRGMQASAREKNINLMLGLGVAARTGLVWQKPAWPEVQEGTDFVPVGPWNTDGLIFTGPLLSEKRIRYTRGLIEAGFPVVFIGSDAGRPALIVDNEGGIRQGIEHLMQHGHRSIAFIAGEEKDAGDSLTRLLAYRKCVREFGLSDDPRLEVYGQHVDIGGFNAMQQLLQSGAKFSAVICSNDNSAIGAMRALQQAGINIPQDVAVIGFDDVRECIAQIPPLTSVHFPLFETGYRAVLLLLKRIEQGSTAVRDETKVSTWVVPRQSCGCLPETISKSAEGGVLSLEQPDQPLTRHTEKLARALSDAILMDNPDLRGVDILPDCRNLANGFLKSLEEGGPKEFQGALANILQQVERRSDLSAHIWQSAITVLRRAAAGFRNDTDSLLDRNVEDMLHQARTILSDSTDRRSARLQVKRSNSDETMGMLTARLISSPDESQIYRALREDLPRVGVRSCHIAFFEPRGDDPVGGSSVRVLEEDAGEIRFETRHFPGSGLFTEDQPWSLAILPMLFQEERMGYAVFDGENLDPLATLVRQVASSIKNARLHAKVRELSLTDGLTGLHNRRYFELLLQKETERSRRYNRDLAVIMIDIDHFKNYNDAFGHPAGDDALREVAGCITRGARRGLDVISRYGGEEFIIILPETGTEGARVVAESVRNQVEADGKFLQPTTVSLGIVSLHGDQLHSQLLVDQADRALYQAKSQGRNQAVIFEDWMREPAHSVGSVAKVSPQDSHPE